MKAYIIQPYYSFDEKDIQKCFLEMVKLLDSVGEDADLILLPEYCDVPAACRTKAAFHGAIAEYNEKIKAKARETAKRCHAIVFFNAADLGEWGARNTTYALDREGNVVYKYYKAHPAPSEVKTEKEGGNELDVSYSYEFRSPDVVEIEGIRFGFMTCYDFYFYESIAPLARQNVDVIIGASHQRTDTHRALSIINSFLSYHTNAYLLRSAVSLGEDSEICGCSCAIAPDGRVLLDMKSKIGVESVEFDPHEKYYKPAGFKGQPKAHYEYIEEGRRPWLYRNGGPGIVPFDKYMPYPRLCAHRGYHSTLPENSMPAFGAAVALGASEIEFDVWSSSDGVPVVSHDPTLERISDGAGNIFDYTLSELSALDFGAKTNGACKNLRIATFEQLLKKLSGRVVMNIHVKTWDYESKDRQTETLASLVEKYYCVRHCYFMSTNTDALLEMRKRLPEAGYCQGAGLGNDIMVEKAIKNGFDKVQFVYWHPYDEKMIARCHENGIICNYFRANTVEEARKLFDIGMDCVLTDEFQLLKSELFPDKNQ